MRGTNLGSILPCNPTHDILIVSHGRGNIKVLTDGCIYGGFTENNTEYNRTYANGTYYWTY